jgi:MFS family permease
MPAETTPAGTGSSAGPSATVLRDPWYLLMCLATLAFWFSVFMHAPLIPLYLDEVGSPAALIGFVYGIGALGALCGRFVIGWAVDRYGERWFLLAGAGIWCATAMWTPMTESALWIAIGWIVKGVGLATFHTAAISWVSRYVPDDQRGRGMGWWATTNALASIAAPLVAVLVMEAHGYSAAFALSMVASGIACLGALAKSTVQPGAIRKATSRLGVFIERSALEPGVIGFLIGMVSSAFVAFVPLLAADAGRINPGLFLAVYAGASIAARPVFGTLSDRWNRSAVIAPSLLIIAIGAAAMYSGGGSPLTLAGAALLGIGVGGSGPALLAWTGDRVPPERRGVASGTYYSLFELGLFVGAGAMGPAIAWLDTRAFLLWGALVAVAAVVFWARHWEGLGPPSPAVADTVPAAAPAATGGRTEKR